MPRATPIKATFSKEGLGRKLLKIFKICAAPISRLTYNRFSMWFSGVAVACRGEGEVAMFVLHAVRCAALPAVVCVASGCATIMSHGPDQVSVATNPAGATVFVGDQPVGQTPMVVTLDRKLEQAAFRLELPGFEPVFVARDKRINGWIWGNLLIGGLIGIVIDFSSGAARRFDDTPIAVGLKPSGDRGPALPPPDLGDEECREKRHRIFVDAQDIQNRDDRMKKLRTAPVCK